MKLTLKDWNKLANERSGTTGTPGSSYRYVDAVVSRRGDEYRVAIREAWGSNQGHLEEHGRHEVAGRGSDVREAMREARADAEKAGMTDKLLAEACSLALDAASESVATTYGKNELVLTGWQIVSVESDENPEGMASFEVYSERFVLNWMANLATAEKPRWRLIPIFEGDVEEPTLVDDEGGQ